MRHWFRRKGLRTVMSAALEVRPTREMSTSLFESHRRVAEENPRAANVAIGDR